MQAYRAYNSLLLSRPITTKSATALILSGISEAGAQYIVNKNAQDDIVERRRQLDYGRVAAYGLLGGLCFAPALHTWYSLLNARCHHAVAKVALDQALFAPAAISSTFACMLTYDGRGTRRNISDKLKKDLYPTLRMNWLVWIPVQAVNLSVILPQWRVLVVNAVGLLWNIYLAKAAR